MNLAGEAQDPAPSPTTMTHHLQKAPLAAADPQTTNAPDPGTALQAQASHAATAAGRPRAWAPTSLASHGHGHASSRAPPPRASRASHHGRGRKATRPCQQGGAADGNQPLDPAS
jgi:hypothetical protein|uniref:Uncharacterized protein n=1 Tax=Zea mays TaxID=4577 RepID=A0A804MUY5_MAIZE